MLNWRIEDAKAMERGDLIEMKNKTLEGRAVNRSVNLDIKTSYFFHSSLESHLNLGHSLPLLTLSFSAKMHNLILLTALLLTPQLSLSTPTPPGIPTASTAKSELASLTVAAQGSQDGYSRDLFPHWIIISGKCDTRETVLKRDGTDVVQSSSCAATSGTWVSPYDGATWTAASDLDIDHLVPLSNAWKVCSRAFKVANKCSCTV